MSEEERKAEKYLGDADRATKCHGWFEKGRCTLKIKVE